MFTIIEANWHRIWFFGMASVSLFLVVLSYFPLASLFSSQFQLANENNFAVWWAGMLLLLAALHASDGYFRLRETKPRAAGAWAVVALILLILSADEIGSIHERATIITHIDSNWLAFLPFAVVLLSLFTYAVVVLWKDGERHRDVLLILFAFFIFGTVALQEFIEHRFVWEPWMTGIRRCIEEGSELLGTIILVKACIVNTKGAFARRMETSPVFDIIISWPKTTAIASLMAAPFLANVTAALPDQFRGHPSDWLSACLFLFAALSVAVRYLKYGQKLDIFQWAMIFICCFASLASVACAPHFHINFPFPDTNFRMLMFFFISNVVSLLWLFDDKTIGGAYLIAIVAILTVTSISVFKSTLAVQYGLPIAIGSLVYAVNATQACLLANIQTKRSVPDRVWIDAASVRFSKDSPP